MKKAWICLCLLFTGCPLSMDATVNWGSNLKMEKTLKVEQTQTPEQTSAGTTIITDIIKVVPLVMTPEPTPTPRPPKIKQIRRKLASPIKDDVCKCELGSGQLCTYHNDRVTCEPVQ